MTLALAAALAAASALTGVAAEPGVARASAPSSNGPLSDERNVTYWAFANRREQIHVAPAASSAAFANLHLVTEVGALEVYVALRRQTDSAGHPWLQIRVPMRPNGRVGWVPEDALSALNLTYTRLVISRRKRRATLLQNGSPVWRAPVGIGKRATPTPRGHFYIRERLRLRGHGGVYGSFAFGTSDYSNRLTDWPGGGVVGIHGTNEPKLIPGAISHGCVRLRNADIADLRRLMELGTPVWIR